MATAAPSARKLREWMCCIPARRFVLEGHSLRQAILVTDDHSPRTDMVLPVLHHLFDDFSIGVSRGFPVDRKDDIAKMQTRSVRRPKPVGVKDHWLMVCFVSE